MKDDRTAITIIVIAWFMLIGYLIYLDKQKPDISKEIIHYEKEYKSRLDTLIIIINEQHVFNKHLIQLKHDVDSLKAVKRH